MTDLAPDKVVEIKIPSTYVRRVNITRREYLMDKIKTKNEAYSGFEHRNTAALSSNKCAR